MILAALAFMGFCTAIYLTLYETDVFTHVWEPFFGNGSHAILNSAVSHPFGIPDASLGAALYFLDFWLAFAGGPERWRTHPWFVLLNGATAASLGLAAVILLIIQPVAYNHYCTLCLFSAFISITLAGPTMEEVLAALQQLARQYTQPTERQLGEHRPSSDVEIRSAWDAQGIRLRHLIGAAIGLYLMASPAVLGLSEFARTDVRVTGPIVFFVSMLAVWPATRWFGRLNVFAGMWLIFGPILLEAPTEAILTEIAIGAILIALSYFAGDTASQIGSGWIGILGPGSELYEEGASKTEISQPGEA